MAAQRHDEHEHEHKELGLHNERGFPVTAWSKAPWRIDLFLSGMVEPVGWERREVRVRVRVRA